MNNKEKIPAMLKQSQKVIIALSIVVAVVVGLKLILWPILADINFRKGLRAVSSLEYEKAETKFKIAITYKKEPVYYENLAALYRKMGETAKNRQTGRRHYEQSVYFYKKFIQIRPLSALAYNGLGATCLYIGRDFKEEDFFRSAIDNFMKAIEIEPKFIEAHNNLAVAYYLWGLKDKAFEAYKKALITNPDSITIHFNFGMFYFMEKDYKKAEAIWKIALEIDPENIDVQRGLMKISQKLKVKRKK